MRTLSFTTLCLFLTPLAACSARGFGGDGPLGVAAEAQTVCPGPVTIEGVDVSAYQPNIDWPTVATSSVKFAMIKATEGVTFTDPDFATNWAGAKQNGVVRGAYHFFHSTDDPVAQAQFFVNTVGALDAGDLPCMLDLEVDDGQSASTVASTALTFLQNVEQLSGKKPIVYTGPSFFSDTLGEPAGFGGYPLWIANYDVSCPTVPPSWSTFTFWQDGSADEPGIGSGVDHDFFNGSLDQLVAFAGGTVTPSAQPITQVNGNDAITVVSWPADMHAEVFVTDGASKVQHTWSMGTADTWNPLTPIDGSGAQCGIASGFTLGASGTASVFAPTTGGDTLSSTFDGTQWPALTDFGGTGLSHLSSLAWPDGHLEVFALGSDRTIWHNFTAAGSSTWSGWSSIGGAVDTGVAPILWGDGHAEIFATDKNGTVWHTFSGSGTGFTNGWWTWLSIGGSVSSRPDVVRWADGHIEAFARTTDGHLAHSYYDQNANKWIDFAALSPSVSIDGEPSAIMNVDGAGANAGPEIFARSNGGVVHLWWDGGQYNDFTKLGSVAAGSDPVGWVRLDGRAEVFVVDATFGLSKSYHADAGWTDWASLGGTGTVNTCQPNSTPPETTSAVASANASAASTGSSSTSGAGGSSANASSGSSPMNGDMDGAASNGGCSCEAAGGGSSGLAWLAGLALALVFAGRRRS